MERCGLIQDGSTEKRVLRSPDFSTGSEGLIRGPVNRRRTDTVSGMIERRHLLQMLEAAPPSMSGIAEVTQAVAAMKTDFLQLSDVRAEELRIIYQRRRARLPDTHPTSAAVDWLLNALASYASAYVRVVSFESPGRLMTIWLTEQADSVLATAAHDDRRGSPSELFFPPSDDQLS